MEHTKAPVLALLVILGLFCCLHVSEAIRCYECNSLTSEDCGEGESFKSLHTCFDDRNDTVCYRLKKPESGQFMIYFCDIDPYV